MASVFTKIIQGEIPAFVILEDSKHLAFLDVFPLKKGHVLVIPKKEIDNIFDLDPQELADLNIFAQIVAKAIQKSITCKKVGIVVIGLEVPHAHIHLIPIDQVVDIDFSKPKVKLEQHEFEKIAETIKSAL